MAPSGPACPIATCKKPMEFTQATYRRYTCEKCGSRTVKGTRWHCADHETDICPACGGDGAPSPDCGNGRSKSQWLPPVDAQAAEAASVPTFKVKAFAGRVREEWGMRLTKLLVLVAVLVPFLRLFGHDQLIKLPKSPLPRLRTAASDAGAGLRTAASDLRAKFQEPAEEAEAESKKGKPKVQKAAPASLPASQDEEERLQDKAASLHKQALADQARSIKQDSDERALMRKMKKTYH